MDSVILAAIQNEVDTATDETPKCPAYRCRLRCAGYPAGRQKKGAHEYDRSQVFVSGNGIIGYKKIQKDMTMLMPSKPICQFKRHSFEKHDTDRFRAIELH